MDRRFTECGPESPALIIGGDEWAYLFWELLHRGPKALDMWRILLYISSMKKQMGIRISQEAKDLLVRLAKHLGISQTAVLELAIRQLAKQEKMR